MVSYYVKNMLIFVSIIGLLEQFAFKLSFPRRRESICTLKCTNRAYHGDCKEKRHDKNFGVS